MRYGNDMRILKRVSLIGILFAGLLHLLFLGTAYVHGGIERIAAIRRGPVMFIPLAVGLILPAFVLPTVLFSLHVADGRIRHMLLDRIRLGEGRIEDLESIQLYQGLFAAVLRFTDGTAIRFLGAHVAECERLCGDLLSTAGRTIPVRRGRLC